MFYRLNMPTRGSRQLYDLRKKINKEDCNYYVYMHVKNRKVIYIGMGTFYKYQMCDKSQRCYHGSRNGYNEDGEEKVGVVNFVDEVVLVDFFYDKEFAIMVETELTNELKKCATWEIYNNDSGKTHNADTLEKISRGNKGKQVAEATRKKISENHAHLKGGEHPQAKKVVCINAIGTFKVFTNIQEGSRYYNIKNKTDISKVCKGKRRRCGECDWYYYDQIFEIYFNE